MKIEQMGVKISEVPLLGTISVAPGEGSQAMIDDGEYVSYWERGQLVEMRDALSAAIAELDKSAGGESPSGPFRVGQLLDGDEDLPIGTVIHDGAKDAWTLRPNGGWTCTGADEGRWTLKQIIESYGSAVIVSVP